MKTFCHTYCSGGHQNNHSWFWVSVKWQSKL